MPDENILCPACSRKLRMRESDFGQIIQCPLCAAVFRAPPVAAGAPPAAQPPAASAAAVPAAPAPAPTPAAPVPTPAAPMPAPPLPDRSAARAADPDPVVLEPHNPIDVQRAVLLPGMTLLICGVFNLVIYLLVLGKLAVEGRDRILGMHQESVESLPDVFRQMAQTTPLSDDVIVTMVVAMGVFFSLFAVGTILGGISMLRLRGYGFAVAGCISAFFTNVPFCFFSIPVGIWSLLVLRIPEVREAFGAPTEEESASDEENPEQS